MTSTQPLPKRQLGRLNERQPKKKKGKKRRFSFLLFSPHLLFPHLLFLPSPPHLLLLFFLSHGHLQVMAEQFPFPMNAPLTGRDLEMACAFFVRRPPPFFFPPHITLAYCCSMICFWRLFPSRCSNSTPIHRCFWWLRVLVPSSQYEQSAAVVSQLQPCLQIYPHVKAKVGQYGWLLLPFCFCFVE